MPRAELVLKLVNQFLAHGDPCSPGPFTFGLFHRDRKVSLTQSPIEDQAPSCGVRLSFDRFVRCFARNRVSFKVCLHKGAHIVCCCIDQSRRDNSLYGIHLGWIKEVEPQRTNVRLVSRSAEFIDDDVSLAECGEMRTILSIRVGVLPLRVEDQLPDRRIPLRPAVLRYREYPGDHSLHCVRLTHSGHAEHTGLISNKVIDIDKYRRIILPGCHGTSTRGGISNSSDTDIFNLLIAAGLNVGGNGTQSGTYGLIDSVRGSCVEVVYVVTEIKNKLSILGLLIEGANDAAVQAGEGDAIPREWINIQVQYDRRGWAFMPGQCVTQGFFADSKKIPFQ